VRLILVPILASIALVATILYVFAITNPYDQAVTTVRYPFTLAVKPSIPQTMDTIIIKFSYNVHGLAEAIPRNITILVVMPDGQIVEKTVNHPMSITTLQFPGDFRETRISEGKYSVLMLVNNINQNFTQNFEAVAYPPYVLGLFTFMTKDGQALTFGLLISLITVIYQFLTTRNDEHKRIVNQKADWMRDKGLEYNSLYSTSSVISEYFRVNDQLMKQVELKNPNPLTEEKLLYDMIDLYKAHIHFYKSGIGYFFDDYLSEDFLDNVWYEITKLYDEIVICSPQPLQLPVDGKEHDYLEKFFMDSNGKDLNYYSLVTKSSPLRQEFRTYVTYLRTWLNRPISHSGYSNIKKLYAYHYVYSKLLLLMSSDALLVSYSKTRDVERQIRILYENDAELIEYIDHLNKKIYTTEKLYFKLKFNKRSLIRKRHWWQSRSK
jgi:hypothetical protein